MARLGVHLEWRDPIDTVAPDLGQGRYQLTEILGVGGMAVVYRAYDSRLDVSRAVKVLKPELDGQARVRFFNEARTMAKLHHKHVVIVHDVADDGDRAFLVMELIDGGSIADRMEAFGTLTERMACEVMIATLDGLGCAHEHGIVHRDVKPHNILVGEDGVPKVTDFGIASVSDVSNTRTGAVIGTWAYMAPEQRTDAKAVDLRADIYGAGCTLYKMLTGLDPFDLYSQEIYEETYKDVPASFTDVIQRATRYRRDDRYQDAAAFRAALEELLPSLPDDPAGTPPLGVALAPHQSTFAPTMPEVSPSLTLADQAPEDDRGIPLIWVVGLGMVVILFLGGGGIIGSLVTGLMVMSVEDGTVEVAARVSPPQSPQIPEFTVDEAEQVVRIQRDAAAAPRAEVFTPAPRSVAATTVPVRIESRPPSVVSIDHAQHRSSPWTGALEPGIYLVTIDHPSGGRQFRKKFTVRGRFQYCYDFNTAAPCAK